MGLNLFKGLTKLEDARHRLLNLVEILKTPSLLDGNYGANFVNIYDVLRDIAISVAYQDMYSFWECGWARSNPQEDQSQKI